MVDHDHDHDASPGADGVVAALAARLAALGGRRRLPAPVRGALTGLLVLSTVWGFGRAAVPAHADAFLVAGLVAAAAVALVVGRRRPGA